MRLIIFFFIVLWMNILISFTLASNEKNAQDTQRLSQDEYHKLFRKKREAQHSAVKKMLSVNEPKKQKEMMNILLKKIFEIFVSSFEKISKAQEKAKSPEQLLYDVEFANDVSMVLENTAFTADLALYFPKIFHNLYDKNDGWRRTLEAAVGLSRKAGLLDSETLKAIDFMCQELDIDSNKDPNYRNPYKEDKNKNMETQETPEPPIKKKKEKKKRGPGLSGGKNEL